MKIALLAPSGAGKTTFLTGLYGVLTQDVNEDDKYGINFEMTDSQKKGFLEARYTALIEDNDFGEPSSRLEKYPFALSIRNQNHAKLNIELVDFPGGHLHGIGQGEDAKKEVDATIEELSTCDGFIVLLDGKFVVEGAENNNPRVTQNRLKADAAKQILYKALEKRREYIAKNKGRTDPDAYAFNSGKTPIVFALTKGDVVNRWLGHETNGNKLISLVQALFKGAAQHAADEGTIANLINSQYQQILSMPDVVSLKTAVTVYDEARKSFAPKYLERLLQFVLLAGLNNAVDEYNRRFKEWDNYDTEKWSAARSRERELEAAKAARDTQLNQDPITRIFDWLDGRGGAYHAGKVVNARYEFNSASSEREVTLAVRERARGNKNTAQTFRERILPPEFASILSKGPGKQQFFYQSGLPLESLAQEKWWQDLCEAANTNSEPLLGQS